MDKVHVSMERGYYYIDLWINMKGCHRGAMLPSGRSLILPNVDKVATSPSLSVHYLSVCLSVSLGLSV